MSSKQYYKDYYQKHKEEKIAHQREYNQTDEARLKHLDWIYKGKYGISLQEYNEMFDAQNGCCAICGTHQSELNHRLYVDHDHKTGKARALLCKKCNSGIGMFFDNPEFLDRAAEYLRYYAE